MVAAGEVPLGGRQPRHEGSQGEHRVTYRQLLAMCYLPDCDVSGDGGQQVAGDTGRGADGGGLGAGSVSDSYNRERDSGVPRLPLPGGYRIRHPRRLLPPDRGGAGHPAIQVRIGETISTPAMTISPPAACR